MTPLILSPILKPDHAKLREAYEVAADVMRSVGNVTIRIPKFFQYDGSSLPMPAWPIFGTPFSPQLMGASVFHDWLYHTHQVAKKTADRLFHQMLIEDGIDEQRAWMMKTVVSEFGEPSWENDARDRAYIARLTARITADNRDPANYGLPPKS
ncbi:MAG: DUF1353 domain-containing protein [Micropepsaceae bacterium]